MQEQPKINPRALLGQKIIEASGNALIFGWHIRVVKSDGKVIAGEMPYEKNRYDVAVTNGIISEVWVPQQTKPKK